METFISRFSLCRLTIRSSAWEYRNLRGCKELESLLKYRNIFIELQKLGKFQKYFGGRGDKLDGE